MDVIAIIAQKGGTGKTTLAVSLAIAAEHAGRAVAIVDLDPQASASNWGESPRGHFPRGRLDSTGCGLGMFSMRLENQSADLLLIDTPSRGREQAAMAAAKAAGLILIPCRPAIYDLETVATTR